MTHKKGQLSPSIIAVAVLIVVAGLAFVLSGKFGGIGGAVPAYIEQVEDLQPVCSDSDPDNDYYAAGFARQGRLKYHDYCIDGDLYQYYCEANDVEVTRGYDCPKGCTRGACVR